MNCMKYTALVVLAVALVCSSQATLASIDLPPPNPPVNSLLYGDFTVYSMAFLNSAAGFGPPNSGDPFYVESTPGAIKDFVVVGTGTSSKPATTNIDYVNDAYATPSGTGAPNYFSTVDTATFAHPTKSGGIEPTLNPTTTWNADVSALRSTIGSEEKFVVWFNLNETNNIDGLPGQDELAWAKVVLSGGSVTDKVYYLSAADNPLTLLQDEWADGLTASETSGGPEPNPTTNPNGTGDNAALRDAQWAYVPGKVTVAADGSFLHFGGLLSGDPTGASVINQNLGANNAAFAIYNQELSDLILDPLSGYEHLTADIRLSRIGNGYEQIFIAGARIAPIPEPASILVWGWGLLIAAGGVASWQRLRRAKRA